jgi:hypothetical protein
MADSIVLIDFIKRFPQCFEFDHKQNVFWFDREGGTNGKDTTTDADWRHGEQPS